MLGAQPGLLCQILKIFMNDFDKKDTLAIAKLLLQNNYRAKCKQSPRVDE